VTWVNGEGRGKGEPKPEAASNTTRGHQHGVTVDSTSKCTTEGFEDDLVGCSIAEALARPIIERVNDEGKLMSEDRSYGNPTEVTRASRNCMTTFGTRFAVISKRTKHPG
jgi:hypothetical protein